MGLGLGNITGSGFFGEIINPIGYMQNMNENAANAAAQDKVTAEKNAAAAYQAMYDSAAKNLSPYMQTGQDALGVMRQMLGMSALGGSGTGTGAAPKAAIAGAIQPQDINAAGTRGLYPGYYPYAPGQNPLQLMSGSAYAEPRAMGGPTNPGQSYIVGEHGPEMLHMYPGSRGFVQPNPNTPSPYPAAPVASPMMMRNSGYIHRAIGGPVSGESPGGGIWGQLGMMPPNRTTGAPFTGDTFNQGLSPGTATPTSTPTSGATPGSADPTQTLPGGMTPAQIMSMDPSYQFQLQQGIGALDSSAAANGSLFSGGQDKRIDQYSQGLASQDYSNIYNRYAGLAGVGQSAATSLGELGLYTGMLQGGAYTGQGNALALQQGQIAQGNNAIFNAGAQLVGAYFGGPMGASLGNAAGNAVTGGGSSYPGGGGNNQYSDRRLKTNVQRVGTTRGGVPTYAFNYIWSPERHVGVMADEAAQKYPGAVHYGPNGFLKVDYSAIE